MALLHSFAAWILQYSKLSRVKSSANGGFRFNPPCNFLLHNWGKKTQCTNCTLLKYSTQAHCALSGTLLCTCSKEPTSTKSWWAIFLILVHLCRVFNGGDLDMCGAGRRSKITALCDFFFYVASSFPHWTSTSTEPNKIPQRTSVLAFPGQKCLPGSCPASRPVAHQSSASFIAAGRPALHRRHN